VTHRLGFRPEALDAYRALRADRASDAGKRVKAALERLADDPGAVRGECSRWNSLAGKVWSLPVSGPDDSLWLILWAERPPASIDVFYVGPAPGKTGPDVSWTSQST
jgi:hypothetical protein